MKRILLSLSALVLALCSSFIQTGRTFPELVAENLAGVKISIPKDLEGKTSLIGIAMSEKSRSELSTWYEPLYNIYIKQPDPEDLLEEDKRMVKADDSHVYFVSFAPRATENAEERSQTDATLVEKLKSHILIPKGTHANLKNNLSISNDDEAIIYVLDPQGRIILTLTGEYSDEKIRSVRKLIVEG